MATPLRIMIYMLRKDSTNRIRVTRLSVVNADGSGIRLNALISIILK